MSNSDAPILSLEHRVSNLINNPPFMYLHRIISQFIERSLSYHQNNITFGLK